MNDEYRPSDELREDLRAWQDAVRAEERARHALRKRVADELKATGVTNATIAQHLPWTEENVRLIAREYGVPRLRKRPEQAEN
ncbi:MULTISPECIES: hypothetical protein [unclassified Streptomyces]|uniref:hypothetical protein n=1 Tax=unclassified Streptomyces TaxID=2593676 RepID=UPI00036E40B6|nr:MULTISPECIES: hypothetical protein [unclassified Streptomyces]MYX36525.1 hypothetical protein [Streptomyces sp. SID8377]